MTDLLIVAGVVLVATPLLLVSVYVFAVACGLVLVSLGIVRSFGEDVERRARRAEQ